MIYKQNATGQMLAEIQYTDNPAEQKLLEQQIGRWGKAWQEWVRTEFPTEVQILVIEGQWQIIPREIDAEAENRFRELDEQYRAENPRPLTFEEIQTWEKTRLLTVEHQVMICCSGALTEIYFPRRTV